ncbi:MAG: hypothetical protein M1837_003472 [Sclerophora amabilis]|nr:MAG: hypothetical protein M1837_003472 [Sclerophora amabilis]
MARTRAQERSEANGGDAPASAPPPKQSKTKTSAAAEKKATAGIKNGHDTNGTSTNKKHARVDNDTIQASSKEELTEGDNNAPPPKKIRSDEPPSTAEAKEPPKSPTTANPKLGALLSAYGVPPFQDLPLSNPSSPTPDTILALIFLAMLTSARISHHLAYESFRCLVEAGYHDVEVLKNSSWEERTEVLTKGGYTHYREKTATALGELADFVKEKYDGDLNNLLKRADSSASKTRDLLKEIKGLGEVGINIFFDTAQGLWTCLAPFIDPRSLETADQIGLGRDVEKLWLDVGKDPVEMSRLSSALTMVRLDKKEKEFQ